MWFIMNIVEQQIGPIIKGHSAQEHADPLRLAKSVGYKPTYNTQP
jgi:hypothetical protein